MVKKIILKYVSASDQLDALLTNALCDRHFRASFHIPCGTRGAKICCLTLKMMEVFLVLAVMRLLGRCFQKHESKLVMEVLFCFDGDDNFGYQEGLITQRM